MWLGISELAKLMDVTPRLLQMAASNGEVAARKKDSKSWEIDVSSLPERFMEKLPEELRRQAGSLTPVGSSGSVVLSSQSQAALGRPLTAKEKLRAEIVRFYDGLGNMKEKDRVSVTATEFNISDSTVRRTIRDVRENGFTLPPGGGLGQSWDPEAVSYLQRWYLTFLKNTNVNSKAAAWKAVEKKADEEGWKIGCRSTAYMLLDDIPQIMVRYATAGNRGLDNYFYIDRDWSKLRPGQIWIGDQHICDFWVVDKSLPERWIYYRPTLYVWEDGATRCIAGLAVDRDYDSDTVIESIRMGIMRFGFFDCTYNDNGTSECSKATTQIIDELLVLSGGTSHMKDISELYRTKDGSYVVQDPEGNVVSIDETAQEWSRKHRRIYANVKNAKAKPIERLFSTLETRMAERGVPGHVVTPGAPADQEEKEQKNLDYWKSHDMILTLDEFMKELADEIDAYEHTCHSSLKMSPWQAVQKHIEAGWRARRPKSQEELDFIFLARTRAKIRRGRVTVNGIQYRGEDLKTVVGQFADVGLVLHEGEMVEIRYSKAEPERAYAVFPSCAQKIRPLRMVGSVDMLDDEAMKKAIEWKRGQMKVIREAFARFELPAFTTVETGLTDQVEKAVESASKAGSLPPAEPPRLHVPQEHVHRADTKEKLHATAYERYQWLTDRQLEGTPLTDEELAFMENYEQAPEYALQKGYWETYRRMAGGSQ